MAVPLRSAGPRPRTFSFEARNLRAARGPHRVEARGMKLTSLMVEGNATWGVVEGEEVIALGSIPGSRFSDLKSVIGQEGLDEVRRSMVSAPRIPLKEVTFLPVIPNPEKIFCVGLNYETHRKETGQGPEVVHPTIFARFANTQTAHRCNIIRPRVSTDLDFEGELALIIGKPGRYIERHRAFEHIAGYACYNDASVRDWQHHHTVHARKEFPEHRKLRAMDGHARRIRGS